MMLKVQPGFKLGKQFQEPFVIVSLTATNAVIQVKDDKDGETMIVSRQRLSKCSLHVAKARSWLGKSGKLRIIRKPRPPQARDYKAFKRIRLLDTHSIKQDQDVQLKDQQD